MIDFELISPNDVEHCVINGRENHDLVILEAHFSSIDHPLMADIPVLQHLPGAIQVHPSYLEAGSDAAKYYPFYHCPQDGNLLPHDQLVQAVAALGITPQKTVLVYGTEPDGTMAAARLIWGLMYAGVHKIRLLDGGLRAWLANGSKTVSRVRRATDIPACRLANQVIPDIWVAGGAFRATTEDVRMIAHSNRHRAGKLIDVRTSGEFCGSQTRRYPFSTQAGHIPGAHFQGNWDNLVDGNSGRIGPKLDDVRRRWREQGIIDEQVDQGLTSLVFYCGTGWRSSLSFLVALLLGIRAQNYDDGFYGWSWQDSNKISYGSPP